MYNKQKQLLMIVYRVTALLLGLLGIAFSLGIFRGDFNFSIFVYYTLQSNLLIVVMFAYLAFLSIRDYLKKVPHKTYMPRLKGACMQAIVVTFIIFWVLLAPQSFAMEGGSNYLFSLENQLVHTIVPLLAVFDYILFDTKGHLTKKDPYLWIVIPIIYFVFAIIRAQIGGPLSDNSYYPYFFIDFDKLGLMVLLNVVLLIAFFIGLGFLIYYFDQKMYKKTHKQ